MKLTRRKLLKSSCAMAGGFLLANRESVEARQDGIQRLRINFQKSAIEDLHRRIERIRWPEIPFETGWSAGTNGNVLRDLARYWREKYDWLAVQDELNKLPHFRTVINGEGIHFMHYRAADSRGRFPILLLHGWPGSFVEFMDGARGCTRELTATRALIWSYRRCRDSCSPTRRNRPACMAARSANTCIC